MTALAVLGWLAAAGTLIVGLWALGRWRAGRRGPDPTLDHVKFPNEDPPPPRWGS